MSLCRERAFYETVDYWDPKRYGDADAGRVRLALEWLPANAASVLDLGCGNGIFANRVTGRRVTGLDRSLAALRHVRVPCCQADAVALPFGDGSFDAVVSMEMLEHLPDPSYEPALAEMARVARCYLLITVPYCEDRAVAQVICPSCGCRFHPYWHMRSYDRGTLERLFSANGSFRLLRAEGIVPRQVLRFPRLRLALARLLGHRGAYPWFAICPQCGYRRDRAGREERSSTIGSSHDTRLRRFWPKEQTYVWWMALYERHHK